jgi:ribonuclease HI
LESFTAYIDGGSRGNPGVAGYGVLVLDQKGHTVAELAGHLGIQTNNYAEYSALLAALEYARSHGFESLRVFADSELLVKQIQGSYRVKNPSLKVLHGQAKQLVSQFRSFSIQHVSREKNREADRLANLAMDQKESQISPPSSLTPFLEILAVFEKGAFRPIDAISLPENSTVRLRIEPVQKPHDRRSCDS